MRQIFWLLPVSFGAVVINTMPMWLAELKATAEISETLAGFLGSSLLLAAALSCALRLPYLTPGLGRVAVPLAFSVLATGTVDHPALLAVICLGLGVALGLLTRQALGRLSKGDVLQGVSTALAIGLCISLLVYLALPLFQVSPLWALAALSLALFSVRLDHNESNASPSLGLAHLPFGYLPFFALMGAYWSFIEIYATSLEESRSVAMWLLASLVASVAGSALAAKVPHPLRHLVGHLALSATALSGAIGYWIAAPLLLGISIVANGFFLFLFFPLYLSLQGERAAPAMALYLLGFAFGGLLGASIIALGGYTALAVAILLSPIPVWTVRPFPAAG